jgi:Coenzyme PQQ synthesis protein D (PqqD)
MNTYRINEDNVRWRVVDGEAVIIHLGTSYYYSLNRTGTAAWEKLNEGKSSMPELAAALAGRFAIDQDTMEQDLEPLLEQLLSEDLIQSD